MKRRYILYRRKRGGMFYIEDTETRKQESTGTRNRAEATSLLNCCELFLCRKNGRSAVVWFPGLCPRSHRILWPNSRALIVRLRRAWPFSEFSRGSSFLAALPSYVTTDALAFHTGVVKPGV